MACIPVVPKEFLGIFEHVFSPSRPGVLSRLQFCLTSNALLMLLPAGLQMRVG